MQGAIILTVSLGARVSASGESARPRYQGRGGTLGKFAAKTNRVTESRPVTVETVGRDAGYAVANIGDAPAAIQVLEPPGEGDGTGDPAVACTLDLPAGTVLLFGGEQLRISPSKAA